MMQSIIDLLVLAFGFCARLSGKGVGRAIRLARRIHNRLWVFRIS
jgi:hypothetical protein